MGTEIFHVDCQLNPLQAKGYFLLGLADEYSTYLLDGIFPSLRLDLWQCGARRLSEGSMEVRVTHRHNNNTVNT